MIIYRHLFTPDGTILCSRHVHDYCTHGDKNGKKYIIDGGCMGEYFRSSCNGDEVFLEITTEHPFEVIRQYMYRWNNHTKKYTNLCDISDNWLQNIIDWFIAKEITKNPVFALFIEEKIFRAENEIFVSEPENHELDYA